MLKADGYDEAIIGAAYVWTANGDRNQVYVYDAEIIRSILMKDGMDAEEAREFIEFNVEGAYVGPFTPIFVWTQDEVFDDHEPED